MNNMRAILQIILLALPFLSFAQLGTYMAEPNDFEADSLHLVYEKTTSDTIKMEVSRMLGFYYHERNTDSALYFQNQQLGLARKLGFRLWEADALELCGFMYRNMGQYPVSIQYFHNSLELLEDPKLGDECWKPEVLSKAGTPTAARLTIMGWCYLDMAQLYKHTGDPVKSLQHYRKSIHLGEEINDDILISLSNGSMGHFYRTEGKSDSALYYFNIEVKYTIKSGYYKYYGSVMTNIGNIYFSQGEYEKALNSFHQALQIISENSNMRHLGECYLDLSKLHLHLDYVDSSLLYAKKGFLTAEIIKVPRLKQFTSKMLSEIFARKHEMDSAYFYQSLSNAISDSIINEEKIVLMQNLEFSEQLRINELKAEQEKYHNKIRTRALMSGLVLILIVAGILYRNSRIRKRAYKLLHTQRNELQSTLTELKTTQTQLIQSEKMASLGELTAGIAHEIQNPLNFVNNFSEVNAELIQELKQEIENKEWEEVREIANDIGQNEDKIKHHGKRADGIVKGMLQHSRTTSGEKEATDINELADEYLRLAYHGLRAKDKSFNADFKVDLDESIPKIDVIGQDIGRVLLNLINNAFHEVSAKSKLGDKNYKPEVSVITKKVKDSITISVKDNGDGIPNKIRDKIFQPFFTTKPTGKGTGLGLSLSYDIITKGHGGTLKVETKDGEGSEFKISLPKS